MMHGRYIPTPSSFAGPDGYPYMEDLGQLERCVPQADALGVPAALRGIVTPLHWQVWDHLLATHPDQVFRRYICQGIRAGFRLGFDRSHLLKSVVRNSPSVSERPEVVRAYLAEECALGRVIGPLRCDAFPMVRVSRLGLVPKKTPGSWRLIVDLSAPEGGSVNDGIEGRWCSLSYMTVADALGMVRQLGQGCLLAKVDISKAYRMVPVHPEDRPLLGMLWEDQLYVDGTLPFGLRSAPKIFSAVADAIEWIARQAGLRCIGHYLDDFLLAGSPQSPECRQALGLLLDVFAQLGVPVAQEKTEGPATTLTFLGFEIDTVRMEVRLPRDKLRALQDLLAEWVQKQSCTRRELESLLGSLGHAGYVVEEGKTFLRRLFELLSVARKPWHHIRLNAAARSDLCWWQLFLAPLNHRSVRQSLVPGGQRFTFATDASGSVGCGAVWDYRWFQLKWSELPAAFHDDVVGDSITSKELLPIVLAVGTWGPYWRDSTVLVLCDNQGAAAAVNSGYSKVPRIMQLLRALFFIKARFRVRLSAAYLPGHLNVVADAISRDRLPFLFAQVPEARDGRAAAPYQLAHLLLDSSGDWTSPTWRASFGSCFPLD